MTQMPYRSRLPRSVGAECPLCSHRAGHIKWFGESPSWWCAACNGVTRNLSKDYAEQLVAAGVCQSRKEAK